MKKSSASIGYKWSNPSVISFSRGGDPISAIEKRAREVALNAIDHGWAGPPFDPIGLAEFLRIPISGNASIKEAKTIPISKEKVRIEYNPNRPKGRVRFSVAHEIAHTFFSDCAKEIRYRGNSYRPREDDWQLELLCNIAAAELIMPVGTFSSEVESNLGINGLLSLRKKYEVSMEAILIRAVKLTNQSCNMFCASLIEQGENKGRYQIDYLIPSHSSMPFIERGGLLPRNSIVSECTAIGFTSMGTEKWSGDSNSLRVECVGLPPYPNHRYPRVAGIAFPKLKQAKSKSSITYIVGNALEPRGEGPKIIAHVVNDKTPNWGGRGFASNVKHLYPNVQKDFRDWKLRVGDEFALGSLHSCEADHELVFAQMIAQKGYGPSETPRIRYSALECCFLKLAHLAKENEASVHMPRIGSGYGGGEWGIIEEIIIENLVRNGVSVTVYTLP